MVGDLRGGIRILGHRFQLQRPWLGSSEGGIFPLPGLWGHGRVAPWIGQCSQGVRTEVVGQVQVVPLAPVATPLASARIDYRHDLPRAYGRPVG